MNINCNDRDRIFEDGTSEEWASLEMHAKECQECTREVNAWKALSAAAQELRNYQESPALWKRIEQGLSKEAEQKKLRAERWGWLTAWTNLSLGWQTASAAILVVALTASVSWIYLRPPVNIPKESRERLLKTTALAEVEKTESAYIQAIDKLALESKAQLDNPATPLLASYREKLLVLDSAISNLREQAGMNPSNAHLRRQLLAMYQEKQQTLEDVLEEKR